MSDWGPDRPRLVFRPARHAGMRGVDTWVCDNCGQYGVMHARVCPFCDVRFIEVTTPFDEERDYVVRFRPDLTYVSVAWG